MKYAFELVSVLTGLAILVLNNLIVVEILPFLVPIMNLSGVLIIVTPLVTSLYSGYRKRKVIEKNFISFIMDLSDSINSGMTLPMALEHCSKRDYTFLNPYINRLVSQVSWGVPFKKALESFSQDTRSRVISRAVSTIIQTYRVGGKVSDTLQSVSRSLVTVDKISAERRAAVYSQILMLYLIFFVFIFIIIILQVFLIPSLSTQEISTFSSVQPPMSPQSFSQVFTYFILIQGFFAGLAMGKMSDGEFRAGIKHSLILMSAGYGIFTFASQFQVMLF